MITVSFCKAHRSNVQGRPVRNNYLRERFKILLATLSYEVNRNKKFYFQVREDLIRSKFDIQSLFELILSSTGKVDLRYVLRRYKAEKKPIVTNKNFKNSNHLVDIPKRLFIATFECCKCNFDTPPGNAFCQS